MPRDTADLIQLVIASILRGILAATLVVAAINNSWTLVFSATVALSVSLLPLLIERRKLLFFPIEFELVIAAFIFSAMVLGEGLDFYERIWWWDLMLHAISGVVLGLVGFLMVYLISKEKGVSIPPVFIALFSFCFALALGTVWEIFEYTLDVSFGLNTQRGSLVDTMWDLIVDSLGGILASFMGYFYLSSRHTHVIDRLIRKVVAENRKLLPHASGQVSKTFWK